MSWNEAASLDYEHKDILNPSLEAVKQMVVRFAAGGGAENAEGSWATATRRGGRATLEDLKRSLARGNPAILSPALTPLAHPLDAATRAAFAMGVVKGLELPKPGSVSGLMGDMIPLDVARQIPDSLPNPIRESLCLSARLAIGYDDDRGVIVLHDPSFGPAWEVSYEDFERMWGAAGRWVAPVESGNLAAGADAGEPPRYRARTPNEQAAWCYVHGYANAYVGNAAKAEEQYRGGLELSGLNNGYRFLLLVELAVLVSETGRPDEAIPLAVEATSLVPEVPAPWFMLARTYPKSSIGDRKKLAKQAEKHARALDASPTGNAGIARAMPADFMLAALGGIRGWGGREGSRR